MPDYQQYNVFARQWPLLEKEYFQRLNKEYDIAVLMAGTQCCPPNHKGYVSKDWFIIHYIHSGTGVFSSNKIYKLKRGMTFTIFPSQKGWYYQASDKNPWRYSWIAFIGNKARSLLWEAGISEETPIFNDDPSGSLKKNFVNLYECLNNKIKGFETRADGLLYLLLAKFIELTKLSIPKGKEEGIDEYIGSAIRFIKIEYPRKISVNRISTFIGYEQSYFSKIFKAKTGMNLKQYLIHYRIEKSKELLTHSDIPINQIASLVGYQDYFVFEKQFKKITLLSPSVYRGKNKQN